MVLFRNVFLATLLFIGLKVHAQNIDSLKKQLLIVPDASKSRLLFGIGRVYDAKDNLDSALTWYRASKKEAIRTGDDSIVMVAQYASAMVLRDMQKHDQIIPCFDTVIEMARKLNVPAMLMKALIEKSQASMYLGHIKGVLPDLQEALALTKKNHSSKYESITYAQIGNYYSLFDDYAEEIDYISKSIPISDSLKMYRATALSYYDLSVIYSKRKEYKTALQYADVADSLYRISKEPTGHLAIQMHKGIIYKNMGEYDRAIRIYNDCIDSCGHDDKHQYSLLSIYENLGVAQSLKGDLNAAKHSFFKVLSINTTFKMPDGEVDCNRDLGNAFFIARQYDSALYYALHSEQLCAAYKMNTDLTKQSVTLIRDIYAAEKDWANAHLYDMKNEALQDTLYSQMQARNLADAETRFNVSEKNRTISQLSTENELQKVKGQRETIALVLGAVIIIIVIAVYRRSIRRNRLLATQKHLLEQQKKVIDAQVVQLATAATMKSKFLANISHELRTPVTLLTGMLELMNGKKRSDEIKEKERLDVAYNNSRKLQQMVEEILDLTKLENNIAQPVYEIKEAAPLLKRMVYAFETLMEKEQLQLEYYDANAKGLYISIDQNKFEKVMNNLVYNAVKFNKKGGYVKVKVYPAADNGHINIDVSDSGIGIALEDIPHIFEHFYQGDSQGLKADGAGIGLSLVKEFTTLMGGHVAVKSMPGEGTTFTLQFPLAAQPVADAEPQEILTEPVEQWENFAKRQTVLIVEDNEEMRYYLKEVLGEKVKIAEAENGRDALVWLENNIPDLIISDVMMPGMDGRELVTYLKSQEKYKKIPIITLTALADTESQLSFLRLGVDDYIVKPFNADELRIRVYNLLINLAERNTFNKQPAEPGDIAADSKEAEEFRNKITTYVLNRIRDTNISVTDVAYELSIGERQLQRLAKSLTGCSPLQLIKEVRLQKAYELLLSGDIYKIEDVAHRVGYDRASYFSQQFFERFGKRPAEFL